MSKQTEQIIIVLAVLFFAYKFLLASKQTSGLNVSYSSGGSNTGSYIDDAGSLLDSLSSDYGD